jgi:hypothetical protein
MHGRKVWFGRHACVFQYILAVLLFSVISGVVLCIFILLTLFL